jgi:hypothetical protein
VDAETGKALFREDLRFFATAPGSVFDVSPAETLAALCPVVGNAHTNCASPVTVTFPNLTSTASLSGSQVQVFNCNGGDAPTAPTGIPGTCAAVASVSNAFSFPVDTSFVSATDSFAAAMAYYHLDKHVSFFKAIDPALPPPATTGTNRALRGSIPALVNVKQGGQPFENAFFSGNLDAMVFGQGGAADYSYDAPVAYHEFTHGVVFSWGGFNPDIDSQGGLREPGAVNEGTADSMAVSETGRSQIGAFTSGQGVQPALFLRDMNDAAAARTCQGNGTVVDAFGAQSIKGLDGEVHDDGRSGTASTGRSSRG